MIKFLLIEEMNNNNQLKNLKKVALLKKKYLKYFIKNLKQQIIQIKVILINGQIYLVLYL